MSRHLRIVEDDSACGVCMMPLEDCECPPVDLRRAVMLSEHNDLRAAADRAIRRGFVTLTKRRSLWVRLRDAWWAFWNGLE